MEEIKLQYKYHPRVLELRLILFYTILVREYGANKANGFFQSFCELMTLDWQKINGIINQSSKIRQLEKMDRTRYRQELVFMGWLYDESRYFLAKNILNLSTTVLYRKSANLNLEDFLNEEWLDRLEETVTVCGLPQYGLEAKRFLDAFKQFMETLGNVSSSKV